MAHSPQTPGPQGPPPPGSAMGAPMGSSQPMSRTMPPPNGPQAPIGSALQTPQQAFQSLAGASSNPGSPANPGSMPGRSPSMAQRQVNNPHDIQAINKELTTYEFAVLHNIKNEIGLSNKELSSLTIEEKVCTHYIIASVYLIPNVFCTISNVCC